jgi:hypothetical protein
MRTFLFYCYFQIQIVNLDEWTKNINFYSVYLWVTQKISSQYEPIFIGFT